MFDKGIKGFIDFFKLLFIFDARLLKWRSDGWSLVMSVLIGLILHLDGNISFFEIRLGSIVNFIFIVS